MNEEQNRFSKLASDIVGPAVPEDVGSHGAGDVGNLV